MNAQGQRRYVWSLLAGLCGLAASLYPHPNPAWSQGLSLIAPQHLALAGAGAAWSSAEDPAVRTRLERPQLQVIAGQDHHGQRSIGTQAWIPVARGRNVGLGVGLGPDAQGDAEGRLRAALGQRILGPQSPALGVAMTLRDRLSRRDAGLGLSVDLGLAWVLPWQKLELGAALRELPVASASGAWRREGAVGVGWRRDGLHLALDLCQAVDEWLTLHAGAEKRLNGAWSLQAGIAGSGSAFEPWTWGLGLRRQVGELWWTVATRQPFGYGTAALKAGLGWDLRPLGPVRQVSRAVAFQAAAAPTPRPTPSTGSFPLTAERSQDGVRLRWPAQHAPGGYEVLTALVPDASMRQAPEGLVQQAHWECPLGLPGVTYYFKVRVLDADGSALAESWVLTVAPQQGEP